ncbi:ras GTPase-activating protein 4 [Engraulis encrasicolus]|uniref:ras GTPase-activating protein 4 n=1 Tax=Engraulis encrasicolus TaxID=184585 RepID=UPI002FD11244
MAKRSTLFIRIVEGKNLPIKDITGSSDPYCIVRIDNEAIIRTATIWKTLSPFWGEEYNVHLPPSFHTVSFYVLDEDSLSRDDVIGKVSISKEALTAKPQGIDGWLALSEIDPDEEVQGEIHLHISVVGDGDVPTRLRCQVMEARDLAKKDRNGASDPFVRVRYNGKTCESAVVKKTRYPRWNESFEFELEDASADSPLSVEVWDWDLVSRNDFLGKVLFNINGLQSAQTQQEEGWFRLGPDKPKHSEQEGTLGSLRLQLRLRDETVLPSSHYQPLTELLSQSVGSHVNGNWPDLIMLIDETTTAESRQEVASNLVKLFLGQGLVKEFLDVLFKLELDKTTEPNTLFRSNSLASKSMESFLKVAGMQYLHRLLGPTISKIFEERRYVELDPNRVELREAGCTGLHRTQTEADVIQQSTTYLQSYLSELLNAILQSASYCPLVLCQVFQQLYHRVEARFPDPEYRKVKFIAVTSFLCLRFISPAIMSPKLFHLREKHADARTSRTLLLLAKAIQMIANLDTLAGCSKEPWMNPLQPTIQQGIAQLKDFITRLVSCDEAEDLGLQARMSLQCGSMEKEGYLLLHRTKDKCMPMTSPFKKYFVTLSKDTLSYARTQHSKKSSFICLPRIRAVEKVEEKSFGSANVMQIISGDDIGTLETLYLDCKSVNELNHWLSALRKACSHNTDTMSSYHPGVYKADRWSCCHQKDKADPGCDKTKHGVTLQEWYDPLDPDLESQLIYRHLLGVQQVMKEKYLELKKLHENEEGPHEKSQEKSDEVMRFFSVLQDLHEAHLAVEEEEERARNKNNFLLELQT